MTEELEAMQATLKRLAASQSADAEANRKALTVAMQGVQTALAELLAMNEKADDGAEGTAMSDAAERIVQAIGGIQLDAPTMDFTPTINVAAPAVTVQAPQVNVAAPPAPDVKVTVQQPAMSIALDKGKTVIAFKFDYSGPAITGGTATITRG